MARKKPTNITLVKTLEEANEALEKIAMIKRMIATEELSMNEAIDKIKARAEKEVARYQKDLQPLENGLHAFAEQNKESLFQKKRSIDLNFGSIGFRKAAKLAAMPKTTWNRIVELLEEKGFVSGIRIKKSANKEVLSEWSDEKLAKVNIKRKTTDDFWYEIREEELQAAVE